MASDLLTCLATLHRSIHPINQIVAQLTEALSTPQEISCETITVMMQHFKPVLQLKWLMRADLEYYRHLYTLIYEAYFTIPFHKRVSYNVRTKPQLEHLQDFDRLLTRYHNDFNRLMTNDPADAIPINRQASCEVDD